MFCSSLVFVASDPQHIEDSRCLGLTSAKKYTVVFEVLFTAELCHLGFHANELTYQDAVKRNECNKIRFIFWI